MSSHGFGEDVHRYNPDLYKYEEDHPEDDLDDSDYEEGSMLRGDDEDDSTSEDSKFWLKYVGLLSFVASILLLALVSTSRKDVQALSGQVGSEGLLAGGDVLVDVQLPDILQYNLLDWTPTIWRNYKNDMTPLFWHMPMSAGNVIESALAGCLGLIMASGAARDTPQINQQQLTIVTINKHQYINVDTSTRTGVMRAAELQLASSNAVTPNVIATPFFRLATASLFNPAVKGRLFTLIRHPLDRAVASYEHFIQTNNDAKMTLDEYVDSPHFVNNWMTRFLTGKFYSPLQNDDLRLSATIIRTKTLVGLYDQMEETMHRFETYFDWTPSSATENGRSRVDMCYRHQLQSGGFIDYLGNEQPSSYQQGKVDISLYVRDKLKYDLELYNIAKEVFDYQGFALKDTKDSVQMWDNAENDKQNNAQAKKEEQKQVEEMNADYSQQQQENEQQQQQFTQDEVLAFAEVDKPCLLNSDFSETPPTQNWYGIYADLTIVDGLFGNALKATNRQNQRRGGMWQNIRPDCLEVHRWYEVSADYYIDKAGGDSSKRSNPVHCNPTIMEGTNADSCPGIGLRVGDELIEVGWSVGPLQDDTPGKMGYHEMYGAFKVTEDMLSEQLSIFVARAATDSDIIVDNVSLRPADHTTVGIRGCSSVIANGNAETGDYRYWFIKGSGEDGDGGEIQMVQPGYGGYGYAFKHTGQRADRWKGMVQALDSTCFEVGTAWRITAKFRFFKNLKDERVERPATCSKGSSYDAQSCPVFEVQFYTPGNTYHVSTGQLKNEIDTHIDLGEWNDIEHVFVVDYEMSTFTQVKVHINSVDPAFNYELDDVQMIRLNQEP